MTKTPTTARLRTALLLPGALIAAGILLAGCSSTSAAETTTEESADAAAEAPSQEQMTPAGVSGLIAYAEDGLLQVQADDEQTAVRYTDDTTVTKAVTTDGSAVVVGDCVLVVTDEDGATATTISVTAAADDGTCSSGFGGMPGGGEMPEGGMPDGEMPEGGMPQGGATDAPTDGEMPDRPEGAPTDAPTDGGGFGSFVSGTVTAASDGMLTVEAAGDDAETSEIAYTADTTVTTTVAASTADIAVDLCVTAMGEADDAGGYDATSLVLSDPDDSGSCSSGRAGFPGGRGGQGPNADATTNGSTDGAADGEDSDE